MKFLPLREKAQRIFGTGSEVVSWAMNCIFVRFRKPVLAMLDNKCATDGGFQPPTLAAELVDAESVGSKCQRALDKSSTHRLAIYCVTITHFRTDRVPSRGERKQAKTQQYVAYGKNCTWCTSIQ